MRRFAAVIVLLLGLTWAPAASATVTVTGTPADVARIGRWLAQMQFPALPEQRIIVAACPESPFVLGCTSTEPGAPVYLDPTEVTWPMLYHELGHRFASVMPEGSIRRFATLTHRTRVLPSDERLADAFAACARGLVPRAPVREDMGWVSGHNYFPSARTHRRVCGMLQRTAARLGLARTGAPAPRAAGLPR